MSETRYIWMWAKPAFKTWFSDRNYFRWKGPFTLHDLVVNVIETAEGDDQEVWVRPYQDWSSYLGGSKSTHKKGNIRELIDSPSSRDPSRDASPVQPGKDELTEMEVHLKAAYLCRDIYDRKVVAGMTWTLPPQYDRNACFGVLAQGQHLFVVFRGTATLIDVAKNLSFELSDPKECHGIFAAFSAHHGYWMKLQRCLDVIGEQVEKHHLAPDGSLRKLVLTGHSQGAALAMLLQAVVLRKRLPVPGKIRIPDEFWGAAQCVAFAGPMVFAWGQTSKPTAALVEESSKLAEDLAKTTVNYMYGNDVVPRLFSGIKAVDVIRKLMMWRKQAERIMAAGAVGAGGLGVLVVAGPMTAAILSLLAYKALPATTEESEVDKDSLEERLSNGDLTGELVRNCDLYKHFCRARLLSKVSIRCWNDVGFSMNFAGDHLMKGYASALEALEFKGHSAEDNLLCDLSFLGGPASFAAAACPGRAANVNWQELCTQAKQGNFGPLLEELPKYDKGYVNNIDLGGRLWHYVHQAALLGSREIMFQLLELGVDILKETRDEPKPKTVAVCASERSKGDPLQLWMSNLYMRALGYFEAGVNRLEVSNCLCEDIIQNRWLEDGAYPAELNKVERDALIIETLFQEGFVDLAPMQKALEDLGSRVTAEQVRKNLLELPQQKELLKTELHHRFVDAAKYREYDQVLEILDKHKDQEDKTQLLQRPKPVPPSQARRWSALMQMTYNHARLNDVAGVLGHYLDAEDLRKFLDNDLPEVEAELRQEGTFTVSKRGAAGCVSADSIAKKTWYDDLEDEQARTIRVDVLIMRRLVEEIYQAVQSGRQPIKAAVQEVKNRMLA